MLTLNSLDSLVEGETCTSNQFHNYKLFSNKLLGGPDFCCLTSVWIENFFSWNIVSK